MLLNQLNQRFLGAPEQVLRTQVDLLVLQREVKNQQKTGKSFSLISFKDYPARTEFHYISARCMSSYEFKLNFPNLTRLQFKLKVAESGFSVRLDVYKFQANQQNAIISQHRVKQ